MKKLLSIGLVLACVLVTGSMAQAAMIGDCMFTGFTYMGGSSYNISTADGPSTQKNYFLAQPLNSDYAGINMWGYSWVKFDTLSSTPVASAYMVFNLLGVGSMSAAAASESNPADLNIYLPGAIDVADLTASTLRTELRDNLGSTSSFSGLLTMTANGTYCLDITDLYNSWITGETENNGLVFVSSGSKYASFGNSSGSAPYLSSTVAGTQVPEPVTIALLSLGLGFFIRQKNTINS
jgi:hypothetical protein